MKSLILLFSYSLILLLMYSCSKDESTLIIKPEPPSPEYIEGAISKITLTSITGQTYSMLNFQSVDIFKTTISELEIANQIHIDSFISLYGDLSADSLDAKTDEIQFDDQKPYIDFENQYSFTNSMRKSFIQKESLWLENDDLNLSTHPYYSFLFSSEEMSLLNDIGLVKIGNSLFYATANGFIEIIDGDINKTEQFMNGDSSMLDDSNVINGLNKKSNTCKRWKGKINYYYYNNSKKLVITAVSFKKWPWLAKGTGEMVSYRRKYFGGGWRKHWQKIQVTTQDYFYDGNECEGISHQQYTESSYRPRWGRNAAVKDRAWWFAYEHRALNGASIYGEFYFNSSRKRFWLTW